MVRPFPGSTSPPRRRRKLTPNQTPQKNDVSDWAKIEADYWHYTDQTRAGEDKSMASKFEDATAPLRRQLDLVLNELEKLTTQLEQNKESRDAVAAKLNTLLDQYNEAKNIVATRREEKDKAARAWFDMQPSRQQNRDGGTHVTSRSNPPQAGSISVSEDGNGRIDQAVDISALTSQVMDEPPERGGNHVLCMKRISNEDQPTRQILEAPNRRHADLDPGSHFTQETSHKAVDGKQLMLPMPRINQPGMFDEHYTFSGEPYRYSSGSHYSPRGLTLDLHLTTLLQYLTAPTPRIEPVKVVTFHSSYGVEYFWWDVRKIIEWTSFLPTIKSLSGGGTGSLLNNAVPVSSLPSLESLQDHPNTETDLQSIYTVWLLPRLNAVLQKTCHYPLQLSVPSRTENMEHMFHAIRMPQNTLSGGSCVCVVGLVKSSRQFKTSMRYSGHNFEKINYLQALAHLHYVMRRHACRYGFILTETELVIVRNGTDKIPFFGFLEVIRCQLATNASNPIDLTGDDAEVSEGGGSSSVPIAPWLALWWLCMLASLDSLPQGHVSAHTETGDSTRMKTVKRELWMPYPNQRERREATYKRRWIFPEDPERGRRGVRYPKRAVTLVT